METSRLRASVTLSPPPLTERHTSTLVSLSRHSGREPQSNLLVASLPRVEIQGLASAGTMVSFAHHELIAGVGEPLHHVWFPTAGMISLVSVMRDGSSVEMAMIGSEGLIGVPWLTRPDPEAGCTAIAQSAGTALRVPITSFLELVDSGRALPKLVERFGQTLFYAVGRNAACNCLHSSKERLARWLLVTQDRGGQDEVFVTHEFLSQMLGVKRVCVTHAVGALQALGGIAGQRGRIVLQDRAVLAGCACECYEDDVRRLEHLYD